MQKTAVARSVTERVHVLRIGSHSALPILRWHWQVHEQRLGEANRMIFAGTLEETT